MTFFYSPNDISKTTSKPEWYFENNYPPNDISLFTLWYLKNKLKNRMILRKYPLLRMTVLNSPYNIWKLTSKHEWHLENNLPSKWQFSIHLIIFEQKTSKPEWYLEDNHPSDWQFFYSPYDIWKITSKPEWYLENCLPTDWGFSIHLSIFKK